MQIVNNLLKQYKHGKVGLSGLTDDLLVVYLKKIYTESNRNVVVLTNTLFEANKIYQLLMKEMENPLLFPMDDFLTSEALAISPDLKVSRLETINSIISSDKCQVVVTHLMGFLRYLPPKQEWKNSIVSLAKGISIKKDALIHDLYKIGYTNETIVTKTGEIGTRGYIVDVFPVKESNPIRIEFWGDEIDSIRYFDLDTQLSIKEIDNINIYPFDEFIVDATDEDDRKQKYLSAYTETSKISDYLDNPVIVYIDYNQIKNAYLMLREEIFDYHTQHDNLRQTDYMHFFESINYPDELYVMNIDNIMPDTKLDYIDKYDAKPTPKYNSNIEQLNTDLETYLALGKTIIISFKNNNNINNFVSFLAHPYIVTDENNIFDKKINIIEKDITSGYIINNFVVLTEKDLFKKAETKSVYKSQFKYGTKIKDLAKLSIGDYVVHQIHGIGVYCGIETLVKNGVKKDYLQIR